MGRGKGVGDMRLFEFEREPEEDGVGISAYSRLGDY